MNIVVHVSLLYVGASLGYIPRSGITGSSGSTMSNYLRKSSTHLAIREMQIKTTLRFHLTPVRLAKIQNSDDSRCWQGCGERGTLLYCWWGCKLIQPHWKSVWWFLRKMDIVLPEDPVISTCGHLPQRRVNTEQRYMYPNVHCSSIYNSQKLERTQMSFSR